MTVSELRYLVRWKDLVRNLVAKEVKVRYMGTFLGFAWSLGNPLVISLVYYVVFTYILPTGMDRFALHLITGIIHWMFFAQILPQSCDWLLGNRDLILKIRFPRLLVPVSGMLTVGVFWSAALVVYWGLFPVLGGHFSSAILWYPYVLLSFLCMTFGIGMILSVLQVLYHDIRHLVEVMIPVLFWLTPIVWVSSMLPDGVSQWLAYNPLKVYFDSFTTILHDGAVPSVINLALCGGMAIASLVVGFLVFRKADDLVESL